MSQSKKQHNSGKFQVSQKASVESKLSYMSLHLQYLFEHGVNFRDRIITITGAIDRPMFDFFDAALSEMESQSKEKVVIRLHSEGGYTYEALAIIGRMHTSSVSKIITEGYGHVMSAATLILAAGDERRFSRFGEFMWHESSYGVEGRHSQIKATVKQQEKEEQDWAKWMEEFSNKNAKFWLKHGVGVDAHFSPDQLFEMGVIDKII